MSELLTFALAGIPVGCVYSLLAGGLVLTYTTSGVFNLAFGAQAYVSALVFYVAVAGHGWPAWAGFLLAVVVLGPLLGLLLDRALFRHLRTSSSAAKLICGLGLLVGLPSLAQFAFGDEGRLRPPTIGLPADHVYRFGDYALDGKQITTVAVTVAVIAALAALFRFSPLGLRMRAVVESPRMVELAGISADRVSGLAWMLSSLLAGLAGVLLAPLFASLAVENFTVLLVSAIAAAAFGRLSSLPLTLLGGVVLGAAQQILTGYLPLGSVLATGLRPGLPFLVLIALLLWWPGLRRGPAVSDPLAACDPPPAVPVTLPGEGRLTRPALAALAVAALAVALFALPNYWLFLVTTGLVYTTVFLSITVLTGMSGQISLCQAAFAGVGAFAVGQLAAHFGLSVLLGMLVGAVIAAALGAVVAVPALRLGGLSLALATLAFALLADNVLFPLSWVGGGQSGLAVPRPRLGPIDFTGNRAFFALALVVFCLCAAVVVLVRRGTIGRYLAAMQGSELAAGAVGINPARAKVTVFALSAGIAGLGGGLLASLNGQTSPTDFNFFLSLVFMVLVLTTGARSVGGAFNAGMALVFLPEILSHLPARFGVLQFVLFGLGALAYARHPEGVLEFQKRWLARHLLARRDRPRPDRLPSGPGGLLPARR